MALANKLRNIVISERRTAEESTANMAKDMPMYFGRKEVMKKDLKGVYDQASR